MLQKEKKSKTNYIIVAGVLVFLIIAVFVWRNYEAKHKSELSAARLTTDLSKLEPVDDRSQPKVTKKARVIPKDPEKLLAMTEKALEDKDYFDPGDTNKGFHVYFLLKKCIECNADHDKVVKLADQLKKRSSEGYGAWYVNSSDLADLDKRIKSAQQM
ncbi:hypothetical protein GF312_05270 [Candidatus Poribacteria bacterium]|nr:hypothetical protein [Candidatus Poribacteria bacterium]